MNKNLLIICILLVILFLITFNDRQIEKFRTISKNSSKYNYSSSANYRIVNTGNCTNCNPKCQWKCTTPVVSKKCIPKCQKPVCHTECTEPRDATCNVKCKPPKCKIKCPKNVNDICDENPCKIVCEDPECKVNCVKPKPNCDINCDPPVCNWDCHKPSNTEKPDCRLICDNLDNSFISNSGNWNQIMRGR